PGRSFEYVSRLGRCKRVLELPERKYPAETELIDGPSRLDNNVFGRQTLRPADMMSPIVRRMQRQRRRACSHSSSITDDSDYPARASDIQLSVQLQSHLHAP